MSLFPTRVAALGLSAALVAFAATGCSQAEAPPTASASTAKPKVTKTPHKSSKKSSKPTAKKTSRPAKKTAPEKTATTKAVTKVATSRLTTRTFVATDLGDLKAVKGSTIQLTFGNGQVTVKPGCNTLAGPATWNKGMLSIGGGGLAATKKTCSDALTQQDVWVQALLEAKPKLVLNGSTMKLDDGFNSMTLKEKS